MSFSKSDDGLIVISVVPLPDNKDPVTSISIASPVDVFMISIFPLSASTTSLNVRTIFDDTLTSEASSDGEEDVKVGLLLSTVLKFNSVLLEIPPKLLNAALSTRI